ncbi:MAG: FAM114 family protein [Candidatus Paracaedibacteraceae bacterium]|nr:FAM114 family protein [Candidatus Paracaedibacteraceae bacterium]
MAYIKIESLKHKSCYLLFAISLLGGISPLAIASDHDKNDYLKSETHQKVLAASARTEKIIKELEEKRALFEEVEDNDNIFDKLREKKERELREAEAIQQGLRDRLISLCDRLFDGLFNRPSNSKL